MRMRASRAALALIAFCFISGPAAAQWRYYDGYQAQPAYPAYPGPAPGYQAYPGYPDQTYAPPGRRPPEESNLTAPGDVPPASVDHLDAEAAQSQRTMRVVANPTSEPPGTIIVDTTSRHLYYVVADGRALEYGIGVGREGFAWKGVAAVGRKAEWPRWIPPSDMLKRRPDLPTSMDGGLENPLGARALYLFKGKTDTLFRIHGTNEPDSIGKAVSSGCIRMMNGDVMDLYSRVPVGTRVVVL